jgi:putative DNA primase/helicase
VRTTNAKDELVPWNPNTRRVNDVLNMLAGVDAVIVDDEDSAGIRLSDGAKVSMLALRNGVLDITEGERFGSLIPHSPDYFLMSTLPFEYDPSATCERWLEFLAQTWPDDPESIQLLREWFGYVLSEDMHQEKFLALYGPPQSGKTTIDNVLRALLGGNRIGAVTDTSLTSLGKPFGKVGIDTHKLAVAGDSRWDGKNNNEAVMTILSLTGRTSIEVEHKGKDKYAAIPTARLMLVSNERPALRDASGALMRRLMLLETRHSVGPERRDTRLLDKLVSELPGILNWALEGLTELRARGSFTVPSSTLDEFEEIGRAQSDIQAFVEERCVLEAGARVSVREFNDEYREWRAEVGITFPITDNKIGREFKARFPLLGTDTVRVGEVTEKQRVGIRLAQRDVRVAGVTKNG